jgi:2OG-Fe(II) oxygenase superfamily
MGSSSVSRAGIDALSPKGANACWLSIQILGGPQAVQTMVHSTGAQRADLGWWQSWPRGLRIAGPRAGLCYYRDGGDSVAWHGDTIGRGSTEDTMVAIISVGAARTLALRPRGGGPTIRYEVGHGDLLVMGGSCLRTWEHAVPKTHRPIGPRISIQFRPAGVR